MLNKYHYQHWQPNLVNALDEFPPYYFEEISSLLCNVWCLHTHVHTHKTHFYGTFKKQLMHFCKMGEGFTLNLKSSRIYHIESQFHIWRLKAKQFPYRNIHHANKSSHIIKYWLIYTSLINCSYPNSLPSSTLKSLSLPIW